MPPEIHCFDSSILLFHFNYLKGCKIEEKGDILIVPDDRTRNIGLKCREVHEILGGIS